MKAFIHANDRFQCPFCENVIDGLIITLDGEDSNFTMACSCSFSRRLPGVNLNQLDELDNGDAVKVWDGSRLNFQLLSRRARLWVATVTNEFARFSEAVDDIGG